VVGVDFSEPTIQRARSVLAALGLAIVELTAGDIHDLTAQPCAAPGQYEWVSSPFFLDLALRKPTMA
jgi:hypothetical protein